MPLPLNIQFSIMYISFFAGLLTGGMFDLYRIIRGSNDTKTYNLLLKIYYFGF